MELSERTKEPRKRESLPGWIAKKKRNRRVNYPSKNEGLMNVFGILKSLFVSSLSFVDVASDLWLGLDLVYDFKEQRSAALKTEAEKYGYAVLTVIWLPGIVAFTHLIAHHRQEYLQRKLAFLGKSILLVALYPLVAPISLVIDFFYLTNKKEKRDDRIKKYLDHAPTIEGGVEAPIQVMILTFLMMKGFYVLPWSDSNPDSTIQLGYNTLSLPWLPMFSFTVSALSILKSSLEMNALNMYPGKSTLDLIGGYLPFCISAVSFRVLSTSFFLLYLGEMTAVPLVIVLLGNLIIYYSFGQSIKIPDILEEYIRPESCEKEDGLTINYPIWMNTLVSIIVPTSWINIIDTEEFDENEKEELTTSLHNYHKKYQGKMMRLQIISSTLIILLATGVTAYLVNYTNYKYSPNILNNVTFNVLWVVIMAMGALHLMFSLSIDIYESPAICKPVSKIIENKKKVKTLLKTLLTIISTVIIISPAIIGMAYNLQQVQDPIYLVMNKVGTDGTVNITTIVTRPYYVPITNMTSYEEWGTTLNCVDQNANDYFDKESPLVKDGKHLIIALSNAEDEDSCNNAMLNTDADELSSLGYRSIIMLEDEEFDFKASQKIQFSKKPNFPIVSIR